MYLMKSAVSDLSGHIEDSARAILAKLGKIEYYLSVGFDEKIAAHDRELLSQFQDLKTKINFPPEESVSN